MGVRGVRMFKGQNDYMKIFILFLLLCILLFQFGIIWTGIEYILGKVIGGF